MPNQRLCKHHHPTGKRAASKFIADIVSLVILGVAISLFIIILSLLKQGPSDELYSDILEQQTAITLNNFLNTPVSSLKYYYSLSWKEMQMESDSTVADFIVLMSGNKNYKIPVTKMAEKVFDSKFGSFWNLKMSFSSSSSFSSAPVEIGHSYRYQKAESILASISLFLASPSNPSSLNQFQAWIPPENEKASSTVILSDTNGNEIVVSLETWFLFFGGVI